MTLLISVFAAIICSIIWYANEKARAMRVDILCYMFWGASLMWMVDAITEYIELRAEYFTPAPADMLNDTFLGLSVVAFALVVWVVYLFVKDPCKVMSKKQDESKKKAAKDL